MERRPKIGIHVVAYNAAATLAWVLDRIPESFRSSIDVVLVSDDHSHDSTYEVGLEYQRINESLPITVIRQAHNLGYGGNQKFGYRWMLDRDIDIVVLLHGDGQYAPEVISDVVAPLIDGKADVVLGSRMLMKGGARAGGMPLYKYLGNRTLTSFQNRVAGLRLSEWHSGYRAFSLRSLAMVPFERCSDGFNFDTEVLLLLHEAGARITEVPIPTYYGDEICYVNGISYAYKVSIDVLRYRLGRIGFGTSRPKPATYEWKDSADASHRTVLRLLEAEPAERVLDLGCAGGFFGAMLRPRGHFVVGVDINPPPGTEANLDRLVVADLNQGLPPEVIEGPKFNAVVAADVLEHLQDPERVLVQLREACDDGAVLIASVPNFGHWYPRLRVGFGRFDYDRRGILDATHLRFFTWRSFRRMAQRSGWVVEHRQSTGVPLDILDRGGRATQRSWTRCGISGIDRLGRRVWPSLFSYQFVASLRPDPAYSPSRSSTGIEVVST